MLFIMEKRSNNCSIRWSAKYINIVQNNDIVLTIGPAGTGKTYIAVAFAIAALENHEVDRIGFVGQRWKLGKSWVFTRGSKRKS
ncbi:MAG: hypothetical protein CM1200mP10_01060 [Candidatus Neomarinimicrobiota bacterium]|nr:MAG: hypothetical protein CM1200mP10_01060 [Candidatus Neomarinimicrobiota bacterium]